MEIGRLSATLNYSRFTKVHLFCKYFLFYLCSNFLPSNFPQFNIPLRPDHFNLLEYVTLPNFVLIGGRNVFETNTSMVKYAVTYCIIF